MKILLLAVTMLFGVQALAAGDADAGKALYGTCIACHGAQGEGNKALNAPRLTTCSQWHLLDRRPPTLWRPLV